MKTAFTLSITFLLFLAACDQTGGDTVTSTPREPFIGGTQGLTMEFAPAEPPEAVLDNGEEDFTVTMILKNMGEYTIDANDITLELKGTSENDLCEGSCDFVLQPEEDIEKRVKNPDTGDIQEPPDVYVTFDGLSYQRALAGNNDIPIIVDACYLYETRVSADLCIKDDLQDTTDTELCTISGPQQYSTSGGPVQVTRFEESGSGREAVRFTFHIQHQGGDGDVFKENTDCSDKLVDENQVWVEIESDLDVSCNGLTGGDEKSGYKKLIEGQSAPIPCKVEVDDPSDRVEIVDIKLTYDYEQRASKSVLIKHFE